MSRVKEAVLDVTNAMHNWRADPSPKNAELVTVAVHRVSGFALELEVILNAQQASTEAVSALQSLTEHVTNALPQVCQTCEHIAAFHVPNCLGVCTDGERCNCLAFRAPE